MSIFPLPVFEADADPHHRTSMSDEEIYARLEAPKTIVVKFGYLKFVAEYPHDGTAKPGCGSRLVARTHRGTEVVEMLTTTCSNSGCGKSISRRELLDYIEHSGGKDYPFHNRGRILRVATIEDLNAQSALDGLRKECVKFAKTQIAEMGLKMKLVEAEPILGGEQIAFYYMSEDRIDFRELVQRLAAQFKTRIEMRQVGARDEARLVADYERCGQHCCCKNFLKVLKPVSMRAAKVQKATLDPLKISGRCGRLMCCLRYEDQTYKELKANLPNRNKRVGTVEGPGTVVDTKILVQLVLVRLDHNLQEIAVPVEELMDPEQCPKPGERAAREQREREEADPFRGLSAQEVEGRADDRQRGGSGGRGRRRDQRERGAGASGAGKPQGAPPSPHRSKHQQQDEFRQRSQELDKQGGEGADFINQGDTATPPEAGGGDGPAPGRKKRRRRKKSRREQREGNAPPGGPMNLDQSQPSSPGEPQLNVPDASAGADQSSGGQAGQGGGDARRRRKRRRGKRRRGGGGGGGGGESSGQSPGPTPPQ